MSLEESINNLRRTLQERNEMQLSNARAANSRLLVIQAEAVIRDYDRMRQDVGALVYRIPGSAL